MFPHRLSFPSLRELSIAEFSYSPGHIRPLLNLLARSSCSLDKLEICGLFLPSRDYLDILTHASCDSLTLLTLRPTFPNIFSDPECESFDEELLRRLTLHRNDAVCHHLTSLVIDYCVPTPLCSALLNMVESRIKSHASQVPEEPLHFLQLHLKNNTAELVKIGRRSGMKYSRKRTGSGCFSVRLRRQLEGFREPDLFWLPSLRLSMSQYASILKLNM